MAEERTAAQLVEELRAEQRGCWLRGERVGVEVYLAQHPALQADTDGAVKLIYHEVLLREERGEAPQLDEYLQRFPQWADRLRPLFEVHRALASDPLFTAASTRTPPPRHICCPHCHNPIQLVEAAAPPEILCPACGSSFRLEQGATASWNPRQGADQLGRFELLQRVGVGAFGTVYRARDPELDRIVAIKVPRYAVNPLLREVA